MKLSDYVKSITESAEEAPKIINSGDDEIELCVEESTGKWLARKIDEDVYLFHDKKYLNLSRLKSELDTLYAVEGHTGQGYSKLTPEDMVAYNTVKNVFETVMMQALDRELDPADTARSLFDREIFYT